MFNLRAQSHVNAPQSEVWGIVRDFGSDHLFNPYIKACRRLNDVPVGVGAERELHLYDGSFIHQRIMDFDPDGHMSLEVIDSDLLIRHYVISITVQADGEDRCLVSYRVAYIPPFGPLGYPIGLIFKPILLSRVNHVLRGIAHYVHTREPVGDRVPRAR